MALTDASCRAAKVIKPTKMGDGRGLFLLVQPNGSKLWRLAYTFDGKERLLALGKYPDTGLAAAREAREVARKQIAEGIDPVAAKRAAKSAKTAARDHTFKIVATDFHERWKTGKAPRFVAQAWKRLEDDAFPEIGDRPIEDITSAEILAMVRKVEERGAIDVARRLKQRCSEIFGFAIAEGLATGDPTAVIGKALKPRPRTQHMRMVPTTQLGQLVLAIRKLDSDRISNRALPFALLTATRTNEIRHARWAEIENLDDAATALWRIPATKMKAHREHTIPLSRQARAILLQMKTKTGAGDLIFPGNGGNPMSTNTLLHTLQQRAGVEGQTVHGFRRLFSTILNERQFNRDHIEIQLAHVDRDAVRSVYNAAVYLPQRRVMLQHWADLIDTAAAEAADNFDALLA